MRYRLGLLCIAACGDPEYSGPTIEYAGTAFEYRHVGLRPKIPGARVCVYNEPSLPCATSDAMGAFVVPRVPVGETALVYSADTFVSTVVPLTTIEGQDIADGGTNMLPLNERTILAASAGVTLVPGTGIAYFNVEQTIGVAASIEPVAGLGPIYHDEDGVPDTSLIATTYEGQGEFVNLPPGEYAVRFHQLNTTFTAKLPAAWPIENGARLPIVADAITGVDLHPMTVIMP